MPRLLACSHCHRHVRADATRCPFCGFGPLRTTASAPANWLLMVSVTAGSLGLLACDDDKTSKPTDKPEATTGAPAQPGGDPPAQTTQAEPEPEPGPEVDIYGGPRMMDEPEPEPAPQPTVYGGPRMMDGPSEPIPEPAPEPK
jgi:RNA polymerase subunit RPABC4/transcription elongation factor Spt4